MEKLWNLGVCTADCKSLATSKLKQWKTTIDLPHMNLIIFPAWFKHSKSIVVFHCSACLLQDFCNLLYDTLIDVDIQTSQVQVMSGSLSEIQRTRTTVM